MRFKCILKNNEIIESNTLEQMCKALAHKFDNSIYVIHKPHLVNPQHVKLGILDSIFIYESESNLEYYLSIHSFDEPYGVHQKRSLFVIYNKERTCEIFRKMYITNDLSVGC